MRPWMYNAEASTSPSPASTRPSAIDAQKVARLQFAEMPTVRIDQELPAVIAQREAEVVAHALVEAAAHGEAKRRRQLHAPVPLAIVHGLPPQIGPNLTSARTLTSGTG